MRVCVCGTWRAKLNWLGYRVPEAELPLAHPGESGGEDVSLSGEDGSHGPDAVMGGQTFLSVGGGTRMTTGTSLFQFSLRHFECRNKGISFAMHFPSAGLMFKGSGGDLRSNYEFTHRHHLPLAGVAHTQASVLTGGAEQAAVSVPADAVDEVRVVVHGDEGLACAHVPDYNQVVTAWVGGRERCKA